MDSSKRLTVQKIIDNRILTDPKLRDLELHYLKLMALEQLSDEINDGTYYTVKLKTSLIQEGYQLMLVRMEWTINPVQTQIVKMMVEPDFSNYGWKRLSNSAVEEIVYRLKRYWSKKIYELKNHTQKKKKL